MPQHPIPQLALGVSLLAPVPLAAMWLGASFVGMTPPNRLASHPYRHLLAMALLFGLISPRSDAPTAPPALTCG